jgi:hypothetical protein
MNIVVLKAEERNQEQLNQKPNEKNNSFQQPYFIWDD